MSPWLHGILAALVIGMACWVTFVRTTFAAAIGFVTMGLLVSLAWVAMAAFDVALTEAAIGSGITGALLLGVCHRLKDAPPPQVAGLGVTSKCLVAMLCLALAAGLVVVILSLPEAGPSLAAPAVDAMGALDLGNPVTAVLLAYRAMDTFLEKIVLILALLGVWALSKEESWGGRPGVAQSPERFGALPFLAQMLVPIGIVVGGYQLWHGADYPGGAFQGGTIIAAMWVLAQMAGLTDFPATGSGRLRALILAGPVVFLVMACLGALYAGALLAYPEGQGKLWIVIIEIPVTLSIILILGLLAAGPPRRALS